MNCTFTITTYTIFGKWCANVTGARAISHRNWNILEECFIVYCYCVDVHLRKFTSELLNDKLFFFIWLRVHFNSFQHALMKGEWATAFVRRCWVVFVVAILLNILVTFIICQTMPVLGIDFEFNRSTKLVYRFLRMKMYQKVFSHNNTQWKHIRFLCVSVGIHYFRGPRWIRTNSKGWKSERERKWMRAYAFDVYCFIFPSEILPFSTHSKRMIFREITFVCSLFNVLSFRLLSRAHHKL